MKTIRNKTPRPIKLQLPRGKVLHLGPLKTGQISDDAVEVAAVRKMLEKGEIELLDGDGSRNASGQDGGGVHESTKGYTQSSTSHSQGNR